MYRTGRQVIGAVREDARKVVSGQNADRNGGGVEGDFESLGVLQDRRVERETRGRSCSAHEVFGELRETHGLPAAVNRPLERAYTTHWADTNKHA